MYSPVRRGLMDEIDWNDRLIGIKGSRGVGKTTFLLDYAREHFGADNKECLYINLNHFYFTERTLVDFASEFRGQRGKSAADRPSVQIFGMVERTPLLLR